LLYKPVEWAFDRAKICIEVNSKEEMTFFLLGEGLRDIKLVDKACELRSEGKRGNQPSKSERKLQMTFGELDGQPLKFPENFTTRPSKRLLGLHALSAQWTAQHETPSRQIRGVVYNTSDDPRSEQAMKNFSILTWRQSVPVSVSHQPFGHSILTCCLGSLQHHWENLHPPQKDPMFEIPPHWVRG
jgi:hypothetical protein